VPPELTWVARAMALKIISIKDRDGFVVGETTAFAIEGMNRLGAHRPAGKIADLKDILSEVSQAEITILQKDPRRRVDLLLGVPL
jgi:hypothetical protein